MRLVADVAEYCLLVVVALVVAILAIVLLVHVSSRTLACDERFPHCVGPGMYSGVQHWTASSKNPRGIKGRPAGCPRAWCGCWLALHKYGRHVRSLWLARNWARVGRPAAGPAPGVVAVFKRGRRGGHVGVVTHVPGPGRIVLLSGNDGRAVRERERSTRGVIAWRVI